MRNVEQQAGLFCLNRGWLFSLGDYSVLPGKITHDTVYSYAHAGGAEGPAAASFDDSGWQPVTLPHDWVAYRDFEENACANHGSKERGTGWYRIRFCLEEADRQKQLYLKFEGLSAEAEIYLNGTLVKRSFSGYNGFTLDITDYANFGMVPNVLAVHINASAWEGWWYEGAGIYRNVWMLKKPQVHIRDEGIALRTEKRENGWRLAVETELENHSGQDQSVTLIHEIFAPDGTKTIQITSTASIPANSSAQDISETQILEPVLWDVDAPSLYSIRTSLARDGVEEEFQYHTFGLRTIEFNSDSGFWLNGRNIKLKGFCCHQDHAGIGAAVPYNVKEYHIRKLLSSGANAYRCAHNPDPDILDICDRLGMLVMEENRIFSVEEDNLRGLDGVIRRARNHPCVIMYSIGNEEAWFSNEKGRKIAGTMCRRVKKLDASRPVTAAFSGGFLEPDGAVQSVDVVGINYNELWYDAFRAQFPQKPVCASETVSAYAVRGVYTSDQDAHLLNCYDREKSAWGAHVRNMWRDIDSRPYMAGTFAWTGFDYRGEPSPYQWPSVASFFGAWDSCGYEKGLAYIYQALWSKNPTAHLISPWCDRAQIGKPIDVMVATNGDFVRLYANEQEVASGAVDPYQQFLCTIPCKAGTLRVESYRNGTLIAEDSQHTAGCAVKVVVRPEYDVLETPRLDAAIFHIAVMDQDGEVVPNADHLLQFTVENGEIIGVGNGDPNSHEPDVASMRRVFHGLAQVIVRPAGNGPVRLTAASEGLASGVAEVFLQTGPFVPEITPVSETVIGGWRICKEIFNEKPAGAIILENGDMNSYLPVEFNGQPPRALMFQKRKYGLYFTQYRFGDAGGGSLYFQHINGSVWIYVDGKLVMEQEETNFGPLLVKLPHGLNGEKTISVIVCNTDEEHPYAGICKPVFYRKDEEGEDDE